MLTESALWKRCFTNDFVDSVQCCIGDDILVVGRDTTAIQRTAFTWKIDVDATVLVSMNLGVARTRDKKFGEWSRSSGYLGKRDFTTVLYSSYD